MTKCSLLRPKSARRAVVWNHAPDSTGSATEEEGVILNLNDPETLRKVSAFRQHSN